MMKLVRSIALSLSVAGLSAFSVVACGGTVEHSPQTSASAATKAPIGTNTHGVVKLVGDALGEVPLRPDQRTEIEKLAQDAEARHAPMLEGRKELMLAIADQVEAGAIDRAALQPKIDRVTSELEKARAEDRAAIVKLHGILDKEQRGAFVDALQEKMKAKRGEHMEHAKGFMKMRQLADELKLTDEQRSQIHDVMRGSFKEHMKARGPRHDQDKGGAPAGPPPEWHGRKGHHQGRHHGGPRHEGAHGHKKAFEAFRGDQLDLDAVAPPRDMKGMAAAGAEHTAAMAEKLLPILTAEQRKIAADKLRAMSAKGEGVFLK